MTDVQDKPAEARSEAVRWHCHTRLDKFDGNDLTQPPVETVEIDGNLLMYGGASALWDLFSGGGNVTPFDDTNAYLEVGDSTTAAAATQTTLQGTNKSRKPMSAGYPQHTDGTTSGGASIIYRAVWADADAVFDWNEWGLFNAASGGRMANRKVAALGLKPNTQSWQLTVTLSAS